MQTKALAAIAFVALLGIGFAAGVLYQGSTPSQAAGKRKILRYVCPMHPTYTSDHPGNAPCCGMPMVPVFDDGSAGGLVSGSRLPAGSVSVPASRQQVAGIATGTVEKWAGRGIVRTVGRVVPDERRLYRITAATSGWIEKAHPNTVGSLVRRDEALATFYARESLGAQQSYFYALDARDRFLEQRATEAQMASTNIQLQTAIDTLRALGMSSLQVEELAKSRQRTNTIVMRSPADAFVLARNRLARRAGMRGGASCR